MIAIAGRKKVKLKQKLSLESYWKHKKETREDA